MKVMARVRRCAWHATASTFEATLAAALKMSLLASPKVTEGANAKQYSMQTHSDLLPMTKLKMQI